MLSTLSQELIVEIHILSHGILSNQLIADHQSQLFHLCSYINISDNMNLHPCSHE